MSFNQLRKFRAEQESFREAQLSLLDSDDESGVCTLFSDDESSEDSDSTLLLPQDFFPCSSDEDDVSEDSSCDSESEAMRAFFDDSVHFSDFDSDGFSSDDSESDSE